MSIKQLELNRHHELAEFLRNRRARVSPEQVGLLRGTRRRTPGLRRGEVAQLSGVSLEWYTWLEQGRDIHVSGQVLESLASVLQLDANERAHLFLLALGQPPPVEMFSPPTISPILQQFLDQLGTTPACVVDPRLTVVAWNAAFCVVFGYYATLSEQERNLIWRLFTSPLIKPGSEEWEELARVYLAQFCAEYGRFIKDPSPDCEEDYFKAALSSKPIFARPSCSSARSAPVICKRGGRTGSPTMPPIRSHQALR
ncbi:MAG TPA: helix-turn-helix transcriptional regulator [Ktedonobacteraceae bacterium]